MPQTEERSLSQLTTQQDGGENHARSDLLPVKKKSLTMAPGKK